MLTSSGASLDAGPGIQQTLNRDRFTPYLYLFTPGKKFHQIFVSFLFCCKCILGKQTYSCVHAVALSSSLSVIFHFWTKKREMCVLGKEYRNCVWFDEVIPCLR